MFNVKNEPSDHLPQTQAEQKLPQAKETLAGRNVKVLEDRELHAIAEHYQIKIELFKEIFSQLNQSPEVAETLALCISQGKVNNIKSFLTILSSLTKGLGEGTSEARALKIMSLWGNTGFSQYLSFYKILGKEYEEALALNLASLPWHLQTGLLSAYLKVPESEEVSPQKFLAVLRIASFNQITDTDQMDRLFMLTEADLEVLDKRLSTPDAQMTFNFLQVALRILNKNFSLGEINSLSAKEIEEFCERNQISILAEEPVSEPKDEPLDIASFTKKHGINEEEFAAAFKVFEENKALAEALATCVKQGLVKDPQLFKQTIDQIKTVVGNHDRSANLAFQVMSTLKGDIGHFIYFFDIAKNKQSLALQLAEFLSSSSPSIQETLKTSYTKLLDFQRAQIDDVKLMLILEIAATGRLEEEDSVKLFHLSQRELEILMNVISNSSDTPHNCIKTYISLVLLNIPVGLMRRLTPEALRKCIELTKDLPPEYNLGLGYPYLKETKYNYENTLKLARNLPHYLFLLRTPEHEVVTSSTQESSTKIWEHYIIRQEGSEAWGEKEYSMNQIEYGMKLHEGVTIGVEALHQKKWNFEQLLLFLAHHRKETADSLGQVKTSQSYGYGLLRCGFDSITPCSGGIYEALGKRLRTLHDEWRETKKDHYVVTTKGSQIEGTVKATAGHELDLSKIVLLPTSDYVKHTPFKETPEILTHVSQLYDKALKEPDEKKLLENLGEMFWWICQAKPWIGGDPSIAEMLIKTVWKYNTGKDLPPWKIGLVPWETTVEQPDVKQYGQDFAKIFAAPIS